MRIHTRTVIDIESGKILEDYFHEYSGPVALADRSIQQSANNNSRQAGATASGYGTQAAGIGSNIVPYEERQLQNPIGFTPTETNNMLVAGEQGAGGATAGITGQAGLQALRTRNSGALSGVLDQAARTKQQQLSQNALGVQNESARLGQQKQSQALSGLQGLYGTDVSSQLKAMGIQDQDLDTAIKAGDSGWLQNTEGILSSLGDLGKGIGAARGGK